MHEAQRPGEVLNPERIRWLEGPERDFPYYRGSPISLSGTDWIIVLVALAIGFAILAMPPPRPPFLSRTAYGLLIAALFSAVPLAALAWRARQRPRSVTRRGVLVPAVWPDAHASTRLVSPQPRGESPWAPTRS